MDHIGSHGQLIGELDLLLDAIRKPDLQQPDPRPGRERHWLAIRPPFRFGWLRVVVHEGDVDRVVTAFGQDNPPQDPAQ